MSYNYADAIKRHKYEITVLTYISVIVNENR